MNSPMTKIELADMSDLTTHRYAVILAGGAGTRLWPLSRASMPKQLLPLNGFDSLLQQTVRRVLPRVSPERVLTVTHADHRFEVAGQLHAINAALADGVLSEPMGRNTLPAIAWAVMRIARHDPEALISVFSSDHAVADQMAFQSAWSAAEQVALDGYIGLFGMQPTEPATGYGYIQGGDVLHDRGDGYPALKVQRFVEKPNEPTAKRYLADGGYFWNGGMFVFRAATFLDLLQTLHPEIQAPLSALDHDVRTAPAEMYGALPDLSIDYGLLEYADKVAVIPVDMGWSDLGSWEALYKQRAKDAQGNVTHGNVVTVESKNNMLWSDAGLVATYGLEDVAVIHTRDATLVCPRDKIADMKPLVAAVKAAQPQLTETHLTVARPWGSYTILEEGQSYKIKRIVVNPGAKLSLQMHYHRSEHWVVIAGTARIVNGEQEMFLEENQSTYIPKTYRHRLENPGKIPLQIIEIQTGQYLEEDDIVRFGDIYGRN